MTTRSRISFGVRTLCGGVPDAPLTAGGLPEYVVFEVLTSIETQMLIDLNLSDQNRRVKSKPITLNPNLTDFALNAQSLSVPAFAQLRINPTDTWQEPVDIVNRASIDQAGIDGRLAVAFYGNPPRCSLSWVPQSGDSQVLTLWFDQTIDVDGQLTDEPAIEDAYAVHLKLQTAAQCMELLGGKVGPMLLGQLQRGERQWKDYVDSSFQQGTIRKPSSHPRARQGNRATFRAPGGAVI